MEILGYIYDGFMYLLVLVMFISLIYHGVLFLFRDRRARKLLENNPTLGYDNIMTQSKRYLTSDEIANINRYRIKKGFIEIESKTDKEKYEYIKSNVKELAYIFILISYIAIFYTKYWIVALFSIAISIFLFSIAKVR